MESDVEWSKAVMFDRRFIVFMIVSWLVVLRLIQNGIDQVREEKETLQNAVIEQNLPEAVPVQSP